MMKAAIPPLAVLLVASVAFAQSPLRGAEPVHVAASGGKEKIVRIDFEPMNGSDISGFAQLRNTRSGETNVHVVLHGLKADEVYTLAWGDPSVTCATATVSLGTVRGSRGGTLSWMGTLQGDLSDIGAFAVWPSAVGGETSVLACAQNPDPSE